MKYYYKLTVAYDGTEYCGWQVQDNGRTVQGEMMKAARDLFGDSVTLTGASRTDSGVHADGQVVLLVGKRDIREYNLPLALNGRLPSDIVIVKAEKVDETFHPRYQDLSKTYEYKVWNGPFHLPKDQKYSMHFRHTLDVDRIRKAAVDLIGTHDFVSFASVKLTVEDTVRTIHELTVTEVDGMLTFTVRGDGFLYNMVRIIVGTLLEVGNGRRSPESIKEAIEGRDRSLTGKTALAKGLTLKHIEYVSR